MNELPTRFDAFQYSGCFDPVKLHFSLLRFSMNSGSHEACRALIIDRGRIG